MHAVVQALQDALLRQMGDEVDLIFLYGSQLTGATHRYSDVDLSWTPAHESTWVSFTVMVDDTLYDLYPMHWALLERMAEFRDPSSSVLLRHQIIYQRNAAAAERFAALAERLVALQQPEAHPAMLQRAREILQSMAYDYYLLRLEAKAGHLAGTLKQAQAILRTALHCLAVTNQACIDTRKIPQVLALPMLPPDFAAIVERMLNAWEPGEALGATEALLQSIRELLLREQRQMLQPTPTFAQALDSGYPELKRDLQAVMLACEERDMFALKNSLLSLEHELSHAIAYVRTGVESGEFNRLSEYQQDLAAWGFPPLLPFAVAGDFDGLWRQCLALDQRLREFLTEHAVAMNNFASVADLQPYLAARVAAALSSTGSTIR